MIAPPERLKIAFEQFPLARWAPLFQVLRLERPDLRLEWKSVPFATAESPLLEDADVGLYIQPPRQPGITGLVLETSQMAVLVAIGHRLAAHDEVTVNDVLDVPLPGGPHHDREWRAFWTLDERRVEPPRNTGGEVESAQAGLELVATGRAIATVPALIADCFPHPGVIAIPVTDGPPVTTQLLWRSETKDERVRYLVDLARDMTRQRNGDGSAR